MTPKANLTILALAILIAALIIPAGCNTDPQTGYTTVSQYRGGVRTVFVPIWTRSKDVYRRELEKRLTEALVKRIGLDTPYSISTKEKADSELSGRVEQIEQRALSFNSDTGEPRELEITMVVSFTWKDLRTGQVILERSNFRIAGTYIPPTPFSEDFFLGSEDVVNRLARRIVEQMEADW